MSCPSLFSAIIIGLFALCICLKRKDNEALTSRKTANCSRGRVEQHPDHTDRVPEKFTFAQLYQTKNHTHFKKPKVKDMNEGTMYFRKSKKVILEVGAGA